jgi:two-component system, OmpR family, sensor kinase
MTPRALRSLSLRARLTIWYSLVLVAVAALFAAVVVWQQGRIGMRRVDRELGALSTTLENVLADELSEMPSPAAAAVEAHKTLAAPGHAILVLDPSGHALAGTWSGPPVDASIVASGARTAWTAATPGGDWRAYLRPSGDRKFLLFVAVPLTDVLREQREAEEALWIGLPLVLLLAVAGGWWLASIGLRPITDMARRAESLAPVGMEDFGESDRTDELGQFARAFNGLVARLRQALQTQRRFMADASHELRTPVSIIQTTADVTLARDSRGEDDYREALGTVGAEARRLGRLVDDMLVLARADAGGYPLRRVNLYLNELVADCRRTVDVLARKRGITIRASANGDVPFRGDEDLLRRMLVNLLQNAVMHTRDGSAVVVDVSPNGRTVYIRVTDEGEGIGEADRARIFDRFVQLDAARHNAGAGLGLPIARWIAEAHGGSLELEESGRTGSTFRIVLPMDNSQLLN